MTGKEERAPSEAKPDRGGASLSALFFLLFVITSTSTSTTTAITSISTVALLFAWAWFNFEAILPFTKTTRLRLFMA